MRKIRIDFCDFSPNFSKTDNIWMRLLKQRFEIELCDQADYLFYGPYGHAHRLYSGIRILLCGEPIPADFTECDYAITCWKQDHPRHFYFPQYLEYGSPDLLNKRNETVEEVLAHKDRFCAFIVSNLSRKNAHRVHFFERLSRYKRVDSGGSVRNNIGGQIPGGSGGKREFLRRYKFNIAFENNKLPGYVTEKLFEPLAAGTLPIYWGAPDVSEHFNPGCFINYFDFEDENALIERIIELDQNEAAYLEVVSQPCFPDTHPNRFYDPAPFLDFCERVFNDHITPVARAHKPRFTFGRWLLVKRHHWHPITDE